MDQPRNHPAPNDLVDKRLVVRGLRWHGPTHSLRERVPRVVGAPRRSDGYAFEAPPTGWSRGIRNAARSPFRSPF